MEISISSSKTANYLLIKTSGKIVNIAEWKFLNRQYYDEIVKHNASKVLIDEMKLQNKTNLISACELVQFYSEELPIEARYLKVAVVVDGKYREGTLFWENYAHNRGYNYNAFFSMVEALKFMEK